NGELWSAQTAADVEGLDLSSLIGGGAATPAGPAPHPLQEMAAVLADLEAWHLAAGRREAALEARLARLSALRWAFPEGEDLRLLRRDLETRLAAFRDVPWWSRGMAALADMLVEEDPGHLAEAHA